MTQTNAVARSLHDVGLAAWFGGTLMGAIGLNGAAAQAADPTERAQIAANGWKRWAPFNAAAIGAHLLGGVLLVNANKARIASQQGVAGHTTAKTALTAAALAATAASGVLGARVAKAPAMPSEGATEPSEGTSDDVAKAQKSLRWVQWAIPTLTGGILVISARMGEQQRPGELVSGLVQRVLP